MAISYTYHGFDTVGKLPALRKGGTRVDVADGAAGATLTASGWYRIAASSTSYVLISASATNGTGGEHFPAGHVDTRWIDSGDKIGCSAGA